MFYGFIMNFRKRISYKHNQSSHNVKSNQPIIREKKLNPYFIINHGKSSQLISSKSEEIKIDYLLIL